MHGLTLSPILLLSGILVVLAYLFLGEHPSGLGIAGVCVIALGGYLLSQKNASSAQPPSHPDLDDKTSKSALWSWRLPAAGSIPAAPRSSNQGSTRGPPGGASEATASGFHHPQATSKAASRTASYVNLPIGGDVESASGAVAEQQAASTSRKKPVQGGIKSDGGLASGDEAGGGATAALERKQLPEGCAHWGPLKTLSQQPGSLMMIGVACCWSVTASLDKVGGSALDWSG